MAETASLRSFNPSWRPSWPSRRHPVPAAADIPRVSGEHADPVRLSGSAEHALP
jgi:hypothetical protein